MKANELRIGNWVSPKDAPNMIVKTISNTNVECYYPGSEADNWDFDITDLSPITLTPEILEKCGFVKVTIGMMTSWDYDITPSFITKGWKKLVLAGDYLYLQEWNGREPLDKRDIITLWNRDVMKQFYLHQLQNLFFSITQTELNVEI